MRLLTQPWITGKLLAAIKAGGMPWYSANFEEGSAASIVKVDDTHVRITPYQHWNNDWFWWGVRWNMLGGKTPHYLIAKADRWTVPAANERLAVWATAQDSDTWFDFTTVSVGASDIEFNHGAAFPPGMIYISALPMYPFSRIERKLAEWAAADARITDTPSTTDFILGTATARDADDGSGRTAPALPFYGFMLTNPSGFAKNNMVLTAYNHPSETPGPYSLEGAMSWLLGGTPQAEQLLDWFNVYVYPCLNPQGVYTGFFRSQPEDKTLDHNRQWATPGALECVDAFKVAWTADHPTIDVGIDYHSSSDGDTVYGNAVDPAEEIHAAFTSEMVALEATFDMRLFNTPGMLHKLWLDSYGADLSVIMEQGGVNTRTIANFKTSGENAVKSVATMLAKGRFTNNPGVGSRDMNGLNDRIDFPNPGNLAGSALTISVWVYEDANNAANNQYPICIHDGGDTQYGILFNYGANAVNFIRHGTTDYNWFYNIAPFNGVWRHMLLTSDGGLLSGSAQIYLAGSAVAPMQFTNGSGAETAHTGKLSLGGRIYSDTRNWDGKIAQAGLWNRVLTPTEITNLAAGYAPSLIPSGLQFYFKGNTASLTATPGGLGVADGTTQLTGVGNGPAIVYP